MSTQHVASRTWWSVVIVIVAITALAAAALIVRSSPPAAGSPSQRAAVVARGAHAVDRVKLSVGERTTLYRNDAFRVVAICVDAGGSTVTAEYGVRALENNTLVFSTDAGNETDTNLDPADGLFHWTSYEPSSTTPLYYGYDYYQEFTGESRQGDLLIGRVSAGVHMRGADCIYNGLFVT
jgi:hypothetical protein